MIEAGEGAPSLDELAGAVGMSASHFHRVFKAMTGVTPKGYAMGRRAGRVRDELARGGAVAGAAYRAGCN